MASIIRVKRSTGATAPSSLNFGELGLTIGAGTQANKGERLFVGDNAGNVDVIGGRYFTDLMAHGPGLVASQSNPTTASNGFVAILDQNRKVDQWNVDNLTLDGNVFSSTNTDGDITIDPNGSGEIVIPDDTFLTFGTSKDSKIEYDENGTDQLTFTGSDIRINIATQSNSKDTGSLFTEGGLGVEKNVNIGGNLNVTGISTFASKIVVTGGVEIDNIGISSNVIATRQGGGNQLFIDPYPDGLSNEGTVIIKGDLQVDGTTTTVNSTSATVNDAIMNVGDVTSIRTVLATVGSGSSTIVIDSVVGINTGDVVTGSSSIPSNSSIHSYIPPAGGVGLGTIFISNNTTAGIVTTTQLTVTHAFDTNTDRGISFNYNTATGTANTKIGFFGYNDSTGENSQAPARSFTYIPDATVSNEVVTGTRGNLDIKGIYYQAGDFSTHGVVYFDSTGLQNSTTAPSAATFTSTQLLTAVTEIAITLGSSQAVTAGDLVTQAGGGTQQGVVKTSSSGTTVTLIGVTGTFNTSADLILNGTGTGKTPTNVSTTYTSKPMWTTTIDGGTF
ncbi:MAG: hypothetical protein CMG58_06670 [Candidatus Marinimicrobia bacterium]|nr:hypothetical protein [Candidatus Neomarinimicrobiota bacterium]|tara:strand:- start:4370 stop:6046 length:1677 start_codon:yes stop_codon:yes gene_type:complete